MKLLTGPQPLFPLLDKAYAEAIVTHPGVTVWVPRFRMSRPLYAEASLFFYAALSCWKTESRLKIPILEALTPA